MIHIVHVVEPDPYFEWFKKLVSDLDSKNANQEIITFKDVKSIVCN
jgi:hypothetical protein